MATPNYLNIAPLLQQRNENQLAQQRMAMQQQEMDQGADQNQFMNNLRSQQNTREQAVFDQQQSSEKLTRDLAGTRIIQDAITKGLDPFAIISKIAPNYEAEFDRQAGSGAFRSLSNDQLMQLAKHHEYDVMQRLGMSPQAAPPQFITKAGPRGSIIQVNPVTGEQKQVVGPDNSQPSDINKPPQGYRFSKDGNLEAIPGGPADQKQQGMLTQDTQTLNNSINSFDRLATAANEVLNSPGLAGITGIRGAIPNIPGSSAADAQSSLNTLKSQVAFGVLQDMRNNSKTGGALGAVSDAEGKRLEANLASLENAQSLDAMKASLKKIIEYSNSAKDRVRQAYNLKHGNQSQQNGAAAAPPNPAPKAALDYLAAHPEAIDAFEEKYGYRP